jgi:hypothetical protein
MSLDLDDGLLQVVDGNKLDMLCFPEVIYRNVILIAIGDADFIKFDIVVAKRERKPGEYQYRHQDIPAQGRTIAQKFLVTCR